MIIQNITMKSRIQYFLLCICLGFCVGGCRNANRSSSAPIHLVLSSWDNLGGAKGNWTWESYVPWEHLVRDREYIQIQIRDASGHSRYWIGFTAHDLEWISNGENQVEESGAPIHFILSRPFGEWDFHGKRTARGAAGNFLFRPNMQFVSEVEGICGEKPTFDDLLKLNSANATIEGLRKYQAAGLSLDIDGWLQLLYSGLLPDYAADMKNALGKIDIDSLIECRNSGMTPEFASEYVRAGYAFDHRDLIRLRNSGVQPEFAADLRRGGMMLDVDQLTQLRNSGVQPDYALRVRELGYGDDIEDIIQMRNSGVPEDFIAGIKQSGYRLSIEEIIKLRNSGVTADYLSTVKDAGYSFSVDEVIKLRNSGVTEDFLAEISQPGRKPLPADTIIDLRSRGVSAETIRAIRAE